MLSTNEAQQLLDIANVGCTKGYILEARAIYEALVTLNPVQISACIGLAFSHIVSNEFAEGERVLREKVLATHPHDEEAGIMLGLCQILAGNKAVAQEILEPLAQAKGNRAELARTLLEQARE
ncbi:MAG: tetratricopeptide repeat protein [Desulfovibrionales bacterium]|nr:tetratricopeptide repeat protein [Desulfovibrionales bacterium]